MRRVSAQRLGGDVAVVVGATGSAARSRGASSGSGERMRTRPRLVGFRLQTLAVKALNAVQRLAEGVERERLHVVLEVRDAAARATLRVKAPSCDGAMLIGPLRAQRVFAGRSAPCPSSVAAIVFSVLRALDRVDGADLQVVLQVRADAGQVATRRAMPCAAAARRAPMPESCRICGVPIAPAASTHLAARRAAAPSPARRRRAARPRRRSRGAAVEERRASMCAPVQTCRFGRAATPAAGRPWSRSSGSRRAG